MSEKSQETEDLDHLGKDPLDGVKNQVKTQFRQAFIDLLQQSLESDTPDWNWVKNLYSELRDRICNLTPRRKDRIKEIREQMDVDFFYEMVSHNAFDATSLTKLVCYIFEKIKELEAPVKNVITEAKLDELKTLFGQEGTTLASFVPVFIMSANERLDDVYKDREIFMNFLKEQTKK